MLENIFWLFFDKGVRILVALIVTAWVARYLGPIEFGKLNFSIAFVSLFAAVATLGLNNIVVRDLVRHNEDNGEILGTAFLMQIMGATLVVFITITTFAVIRPYDTLGRFLVTILSFGTIFQSTSVIKYWFESQVQSRYVVWVENLVIMIMSMTRIGLIIFGAPLIAFVWTILLEAFLMAFGLTIIYLRLCGPLKGFWTTSSARARALLKDSWPLMISGIAIMMYMRIDQIMLGEMVGDEAVGIYSAAVKISEIWYMIPMILSATLFPAIIKSKSENEEIYRRQILISLSTLVGIAISVILATSLLSDWLILLLFGSNFSDSVQILKLHIWASIFVFIGVGGSRWYIMENLQHIALFRTIAGAIVNILLNLIMIPRYGAIGCAISTIISYSLSGYILDAVSPRTFYIFLLKSRALLFWPWILINHSRKV